MRAPVRVEALARKARPGRILPEGAMNSAADSLPMAHGRSLPLWRGEYQEQGGAAQACQVSGRSRSAQGLRLHPVGARVCQQIASLTRLIGSFGVRTLDAVGRALFWDDAAVLERRGGPTWAAASRSAASGGWLLRSSARSRGRVGERLTRRGERTSSHPRKRARQVAKAGAPLQRTVNT